MDFDKANAKIPDCCRLYFDVGELNFEQYSENRIVMESRSPHANKLNLRKQHDLKKNISKSDIILRSWINHELLGVWPELENLLKTFPHERYAKAHLRKFPPKSQLGIHRDGIDQSGQPKTDSQYEMFNRTLRIHIPLKTNPDSYLYCNGKFYSLGEGECWMLNNFQQHTAANFSTTDYRIHLILDVEPCLDTMSLVENADKELGYESKDLYQQLCQ